MSEAVHHEPQLLDTQDRVLQLVLEHGPVSAVQLARMLDLTPAGVRRHIAALEGEGRIVVRDQASRGPRGRGPAWLRSDGWHWCCNQHR